MNMNMEVVRLSLILIALLFTISILAGADVSFSSLSNSDLDIVNTCNRSSDERILNLTEREDYLLSSIGTLHSLVVVGVIVLEAHLINIVIAPLLFGGVYILGIKILLIVISLMLFSGALPRVFAAKYPLKFSRFAALPLLILMRLSRPLLFVCDALEVWIDEKVSKPKVHISIDELSNVIEMTENQTTEEKRILSGIVKIVNTEVRQIMQPRYDIVALDAKCDFETVLKVIIESGFSRIPVYGDNIDNIIGVLYVKDMLPYISMTSSFGWSRFVRKVYFVPEQKKIDDLLREFQSNKVHIAIVVDEYGSTLGLVSLEDILEEVVGEISDESDVEDTNFYKMIDEDNYIFEGQVLLVEFMSIIGVDFTPISSHTQNVETLAGLMLEINKDFLAVGDSVSYHNITLTVDAIDTRRIEKVRVNINRS